MSSQNIIPIRGRGAASNPQNRFESLRYVADPEADPAEAPSPRTVFLKDTSSKILSRNDSPDIPFTYSLNPYRGCEHGCIYCYARPTHEYLGFSSGLDFETKIMVKEDAPELLRKEFSSPKWKPEVLALSGVTDPYQPIERKLEITRRCLEVCAEFRNPVTLVTKNQLIARDLDPLKKLAAVNACAVFLSITTLDADLWSRMEPRTSHPKARLKTIETLANAGIPVGFLMAPVIPGLTDSEIPSVVQAAAKAGAKFGGYVLLRLPHQVKDLFENWLDTHFPSHKEKVLSRLRQLRGGELNDSQFGSRMKGRGLFAEMIRNLFEVSCKKSGIQSRGPTLSTAAFRKIETSQIVFDFGV